MFQKKIKKYRHLLESYAFQKREIKQLTICSITAKLIIEAFKEVKNNSFSIKEQKRFKVLEEYRKELLKSNELICFDEIGNQSCLPLSSVVKKGERSCRICSTTNSCSSISLCFQTGIVLI